MNSSTCLASGQLLQHVGLLGRGLYAPLHLLHGFVGGLEAAEAGIEAGEVGGKGQHVRVGVEQEGGGGRGQAASHHGGEVHPGVGVACAAIW